MPRRMITRLFRGALLPLAGLLLVTSSGFAQSAAFTYQGRLTDGGNPANINEFEMGRRFGCDWKLVKRS